MKNIILTALFLTASLSGFSQKDKDATSHYGGPLFLLSHSIQGNSLSFGGWGTFIVKSDFQIGIYGVVGSSIISKPALIKDREDEEIKSRFTGVWLGYYQSFENFPRIHISYYSRIGFGSVYLENDALSSTIYNKAVQFSPTIEPVIKINSFICIGLGVYYDFHSGIDFLNYSNSDFNAVGLNLSVRFFGTQ